MPICAPRSSSRSSPPKAGGTGLGLAVSLGIVQGHGGRIEIERAPGAGTRFSIRLPMRGTANPASRLRRAVRS
ncbi:MAG: ATP-binding protein [Kouleothrix sp.]